MHHSSLYLPEIIFFYGRSLDFILPRGTIFIPIEFFIMVWLFLLFTILPILELVILIEAGTLLGLYRTLGIIVVTAFFGAWMWKGQGLRVWNKIQLKLRREEIPGNELLEGVVILAGGIVLITPGFLTDTLGFISLIPSTRTLILNLLKKWLKKLIQTGKIRFFISKEEDLF